MKTDSRLTIEIPSSRRFKKQQSFMQEALSNAKYGSRPLCELRKERYFNQEKRFVKTQPVKIKVW